MLRFFGSSASSGISQATLDAAVVTLQDKATAATDAELSAAVATLTTSLGTKQSSATAATDAELASAVALLQDKATAATDTELAAAIATVNSAISLKQDASTAATDTELNAAVLTIPKPWTASTAYVANQWVIAPGGYLAQAKSSFTTGASYVSTNWNEYAYGKELGYAERFTTDTTTNTTLTDAGLNANLINGVAIYGLVGTGQPVDIEFYCPYAGHSLVSKNVTASIMSNGVAIASSQCVSPSTSAGMEILARRRMVLVAGTTYDFTIGKSCATGTGSYVPAAGPMYLSVTQR